MLVVYELTLRGPPTNSAVQLPVAGATLLDQVPLFVPYSHEIDVRTGHVRVLLMELTARVPLSVLTYWDPVLESSFRAATVREPRPADAIDCSAFVRSLKRQLAALRPFTC